MLQSREGFAILGYIIYAKAGKVWTRGLLCLVNLIANILQ